MLKAVTVAKYNPFLVYSSHYAGIFAMYSGDLVWCNICNTIYEKWFETFSALLNSNVNVLQENTEVRDAVKACDILDMHYALFIIDDIILY